MKVMKLTKQMPDREVSSRIKAICMMKAFEVTQSMSKKERKNYIMKDIIHTMLTNLSDEDILEFGEDIPTDLIDITAQKIEADENDNQVLN
jgi:hypothetical protein